MLFNSAEFLFFFLPITLLVFHMLGRAGQIKAATYWLVVASLAFYGWWEPKYLVLILASITGNLCTAIALERLPGNKTVARWALLCGGVCANLLAIAWFKYAVFLGSVSNDWFGTSFHLQTILLPLAISFFTFQQIAYLVEVYRRSHGAGELGTYFLFVTFFPQLIAGPIVKYCDMAPQFQTLSAGLRSSNLLLGLMVFAVGLFKKVIIADGVAPYSDTVFSMAANGASPTLLEAWAGALAYSLQLYFDFSGYSDMALGLACMLGIRLPQNFASPYRASSIIEFWRRWHITLSNFLRDYLYVPLGGSQHGTSRTLINLVIVMVLGGLWHGAGWTFIAWGALHGMYLLVNHLWRGYRRQATYKPGRNVRWQAILRVPAVVSSHALTLLAVVVGWVLFRASTLAEAHRILAGMFGFNGIALPSSWEHRHAGLVELLQSFGVSFQSLPTLGPLFTPIGDVLRLVSGGTAPDQAGTLTALVTLSVPLLIVFALPNTTELMRYRWTKTTVCIAAPLCACLAAYAAFGGGTSQFLYFNF